MFMHLCFLFSKLSWVMASLFLSCLHIYTNLCLLCIHISYFSDAKFQISSPFGSLMAALCLRIAQVPTRPPWLFTCHFLILLPEIICCTQTEQLLLSKGIWLFLIQFNDLDSLVVLLMCVLVILKTKPWIMFGKQYLLHSLSSEVCCQMINPSICLIFKQTNKSWQTLLF